MKQYLRWWSMFVPLLAACLLPGLPNRAVAAEPEGLARCAAIGDDSARLRCYDELAGRTPAPPEAVAPQEPRPPQEAAATFDPGKGNDGEKPDQHSPLSARWELEPGTKQGRFNFTAYRPNYFLPFDYTNHPNVTPSAPGQPPVVTPQDLDHTEAMFQLSFKVKLAEGLLGTRDDLWFGYTQQSVWQMYNKALSSPFRNTDYEPEVMYVIPTDVNFLAMKLRMVSLGLSHQSNGNGEPLSRSWNRAYAQFGLEGENFVLMVKPWYRFDEDTPDDDNPDISDYVGRGEILGVYRLGKQELSARWRNNFQRHDNRGSIQLGWSFPLTGKLKGYAQFFNGYGETLLDYNHQQTTFGVGFLLTDWF